MRERWAGRRFRFGPVETDLAAGRGVCSEAAFTRRSLPVKAASSSLYPQNHPIVGRDNALGHKQSGGFLITCTAIMGKMIGDKARPAVRKA